MNFGKDCYGYTCGFINKDPVSANAPSLCEQINLNNQMIDVSMESYKSNLLRCIKLLAAPIHSHSLASTRVLTSTVNSKENREVIYGGEGADELFVGYPVYLNMSLNQNNIVESPYSRVVNNIVSNPELTNEFDYRMANDLVKIQDILTTFGEDKFSAIKRANCVIDYMYQLPMVGLIATDTITADTGLEGRTPYVRNGLARIILNSPLRYCLGNSVKDQLIPKAPLCEIFEKRFSRVPLEKIGFSGFPNESKIYLGDQKNWLVFDVFPFMNDWMSQSRELSWKVINIEWFLRVWFGDD